MRVGSRDACPLVQSVQGGGRFRQFLFIECGEEQRDLSVLNLRLWGGVCWSVCAGVLEALRHMHPTYDLASLLEILTGAFWLRLGTSSADAHPLCTVTFREFVPINPGHCWCSDTLSCNEPYSQWARFLQLAAFLPALLSILSKHQTL